MASLLIIYISKWSGEIAESPNIYVKRSSKIICHIIINTY